MFKPQQFLLVLLVCVACGSKFEPGNGSGGTDGAGATSDGGASQAGAPAMGGGETSAGDSAGGSSSAGETSTGGRATAGGGAAHGGAAQGGAAHGGAANGGAAQGGAAQGGAASAGASTGGAGGGNGSAGAPGADCATLKTEYAALVEKARVCDKGSTDQCTTTSKTLPIGCGCPTLVNATSQYTALAMEKYKAIEKNNCNNGVICASVCLPPTSAGCVPSSGMGPSEFVCTGTNGIPVPN